MTTSTVLGIPFLSSQQATPEIPHNQALYMIEAMLRGVKAIQNAPPGGPADGDTYIVGTAGSGAWLGKNNCVAVYMSNAWRFIPGFDTLGAQIAMGANQEGMSLWNIALDARYTWTGAAWSVASGVAASGVSNTPAGNIAATNVQAAINELDTEKVAKAGDTMTGGLTVNSAAATALKAVQTTSGLTQTDSAIVVQSDDGGASGPTLTFFHNTLSPAVNDLTRIRFYSMNSAAVPYLAGQIGLVIDDPVSGSEDSRLRFVAANGGSLTVQLNVGNGVFTEGATGSGQGPGTVNATNYFDDGANINTIYANLAGANVFLAGQTMTELIVRGIPTRQLYMRSVAGVMHIDSYDNPITATQDFILNGNPLRFFTQDVERFAIATGLYSVGATGGNQGANTVNASAYYANANIIADTSGLLRTRTYTVATLPASGGVTGAFARVSDSLAAPVYNAAAVGGGTTFAQVTSDGTNWRYC